MFYTLEKLFYKIINIFIVTGYLIYTFSKEFILSNFGHRKKEYQKLNKRLNILLIKLAASISKSDGQVSSEEIKAFKEHFRIDEHNLKGASDYFKDATTSDLNTSNITEKIYDLTGGDKATLLQIAVGFMKIAHADNVLDHSEKEMIRLILFGFHFSNQEIERFFLIFESGSDEFISETDQTQKHLKILGVEANATFAQIKKQYRTLARIHHPDMLIAKGMSQEMIDKSQEILKKFNNSYAWLEKHYEK